MKRLEAMETKQEAMSSKLNQSILSQAQPIFRPAYQTQLVSPPGIITQAQWGSQNQLGQSQTQSQFQ